MNNLLDAFYTFVNQTQANLEFLLSIIGGIWAIFIVTVLSGYSLLAIGLEPRKLTGLIGILTAPFLHASFNHIFFNSIPLFILSDFLLMKGPNFYINISLYLIILSGILTWLLAKPGIHVGASSVITGYWSFLVMEAYTQGGVLAFVLAFICIYFFAGVFFGILPQDKFVSWEGHLFGFIAGIAINLCQSWLPALYVLGF